MGRRWPLQSVGSTALNTHHAHLPRPIQIRPRPVVQILLHRRPEIHFALNCGALSCPAIRVYKARTIDRALENAARNFIDSDVIIHGNTVRVSRIFKWCVWAVGKGGGRVG